MKTSNFSGMRRIQSLKFGKRIISNDYEVTLVSVKRRASLSCFRCNVPYLLRQLIWRLKSHCKRALSAKRSGVRYSYDPRSYALNFDDGLL
ncbi:hypothetical protein TIFTF001_018222 [Ficus carica]|uniref:Uncharacterized protein n=1 Tax=Ficus carica TaxID=3494 RepID=A0AA88AAP6_FICCA|nr:hypothetical protein TIFTF001_018222 [Ficus carica]